jgi:AraC-like DNA-binding protein
MLLAVTRASRTTYGRCADLGGLEWLRADDLRPFAPHMHETFSIGFVRAGANVFRRDRSRIVAEAGRICLVNPGEVHTGGEGGVRWTLWNVYPTEEQLGSVAREVAGASRAVPRFQRSAIDDPVVTRPMVALFEALERPASVLERETALLGVLAALVARHAERRSTPVRVAREPRAVRLAREHLHAHATENVSLATLAAVTSLSRYHLVRVFSAAVGMPPHAYQLMLRLGRAKDAIASGGPIAQVAAACGFADQAHLTRRFRRVFGATPGQVARAAGRKNVQDRRDARA